MRTLIATGMSILALATWGCGDDEVAEATADAGTGGTMVTGGSGGTDGSGGSSASGGSGGTGASGGSGGTGGAPLVDQGMDIFRNDTFGGEQFWTDTLQMHEVISTSVDPMTALSIGLKVDSEALPQGILEEVDLEDPATTVALLELDAVVGVKGEVNDQGELVSVGITCALCHSTVDDSVMPGIGQRIDGRANSDLDPGMILSLSPFFDQPTRDVLTSWGPGFFDSRFNQDGINGPVLIPSILGLEGVALETYTGDGEISYWNSYVAVTQMGGQGDFSDERLGIAIDVEEDLVTPKLPALLAYQLSLEEPVTPASEFDADAAARGQALFEGAAQCSTCHSGPNVTDAGETLHEPEEVGMDPGYAMRSATGMYRTTPLRALWLQQAYFHDGSAATLEDVVAHYNEHLALELTADEQSDLVEYLGSI